MKPLIGITMNPDVRGGDRIGRLYSAYMEAVREAGGIPVMLFDGEDEAETLAMKLDGLLLSGGDDIDPKYFNEENLRSLGIDEGRDRLEMALLPAFIAAGKPVLGICRGIQLMAVALGGTLWQDIALQTGIDHKYDTTHEIIVREGTFLSPALPERAEVNSTHHQSVRALPPRFMVAAAAPDGIVEAIQATDRRLYGVQFHPERLYKTDPRMVSIFRVLIG